MLPKVKELVFFAVRTGLEPATPGVTGRYSNQLNYRTNCSVLKRFCLTRMQRYAKNRNLQIFCVLFVKILLFDLNHPLFLLCLRLLQFWYCYLENAVSNLSINVFSVGVVGKEESLAEFRV